MSKANGTVTGAHKTFPSSKSPSLAVVPATEAERTAIWTKNADEWRGALSLEDYLTREKFLASQDLTKGGGITIWILIDTTDSSRTVLSSCDTYRKKVITSVNGTVSNNVSHGVGSVFCPPECRGKGYATRMMQEVSHKLKTWQVPEGQCAAASHLFSDIGRKYYANFGWETFKSTHISIPRDTNLDHLADLPEARPLYASDLPTLCAIDEQLIRSSLKAAPKDKSYFVLVPDIQTIQWHHAREEYIGGKLHGKVPEVKGAIVGTEVGKRVWCYFTRVFYNPDPTEHEDNTLHILRIVVEEQGLFTWEKASKEESMRPYSPAVAALFKLAIGEAKKWTLADVELWSPTAATVSAMQLLKPGAAAKDREESISCLQWYMPRKTTGLLTEELEWLGDEKQGWN